MDEFSKTVASLIGISTLAAASRSVLSDDRRTIKGFFRAIVLATFVGGITGGLIQAYHFSPETQGAIVGICAFVADDLLMSLVNLAAYIRTDPSRIIDIIINRRPPGV